MIYCQALLVSVLHYKQWGDILIPHGLQDRLPQLFKILMPQLQMHDITYQYGFNEAAGNFQNDNYGKGEVAMME